MCIYMTERESQGEGEEGGREKILDKVSSCHDPLVPALQLLRILGACVCAWCIFQVDPGIHGAAMWLPDLPGTRVTAEPQCD